MKYLHVYFRISGTYKWGEGFTQQQGEDFKEEVNRLFISVGWTIQGGECSHYADRAKKGKQDIHLHPMELVGTVEESNIKQIEELLAAAKTFKHYATDIIGEIFDITDEEYLLQLGAKTREIERRITAAYTTKRKNLFVPGTGLVFDIAEKYSIKRVGGPLYGFSCTRLEYEFVETVFKKLLADGKLVESKTKHGKGYRAATPKDLAAIAS